MYINSWDFKVKQASKKINKNISINFKFVINSFVTQLIYTNVFNENI